MHNVRQNKLVTALVRCLLALLCLLGLHTPAVAASGPTATSPQDNPPPLARQGQLDLSDWNWERDGTINLNGQWEFYWHQLLTPEDLRGPKTVAPSGWIGVPGAWNGYTVDGRELAGTGYATFRLRVILPEDSRRLALHIPYEYTAYRLWANGQPMAANGVVGVDAGHSRPQYLPETISVQPDGRVLDLVVQVSNFDHRRGGLWSSLLLGPERAVVSADTRRVAWSSALFGVLLAAGVYHLLIYRLRTSASSSLYLGLLTLLMAVRTAVSEELLLMRFAPRFPWHGVLMAEYLTYELALPLAVFFLQSLFPAEAPRALIRSAVWVGLLLAARTLFLPTIFTSQSIFLDQDSSVLFGLWALVALGKAVRNRREHAPLFLVCCLFCLGTIGNDILYNNQAPSTGLLLAPVGVLGFVIGTTFILAKQHSAAFRLQAELAARNTELAGSLQRHLQELREARRVLASQDEKLRKHIAEALHGRVQNKLLLAQLQLARIRELLPANPVRSAEELAEVETRLESLREEEIRRLSHLLHPAIVSIGLIPAVEALADEYAGLLNVVLQVDPELQRLDDPLAGRIPESVRLTVYRVLAEALQNALRHAAAHTVTIELRLSDGGSMAVRVHDDGRGFVPDQVTTGLGLQTMGARITESGGSWELQSTVGEGTTLVFSIPLEWAAQT